MDNLFDLPAHPLIVHIPVVFTPLAALGAVAVSLKRSWLRRLGWLVIGLTALALVGTHLAVESGDSLEDRVRETVLIEDHADIARPARTLALVLLAATATLVAHEELRRRRAYTFTTTGAPSAGGRWIHAGLATVTVLAAIASVAGVVRAGHSGARAVWEDNPALDHSESGD